MTYLTDENLMFNTVATNSKRMATVVNIFPLIWTTHANKNDAQFSPLLFDNNHLWNFWQIVHKYNSNTTAYDEEYKCAYNTYIEAIKKCKYERFALMFLIVYNQINRNDLLFLLNDSDYIYCNLDVVKEDTNMLSLYKFPRGAIIKDQTKEHHNNAIYSSVDGNVEAHILFNKQCVEFDNDKILSFTIEI